MTSKKNYSVIIPSKNRPQLLLDAVSSVLEQRRSDIEIIIADNSDDHFAIAGEEVIADGSVRYYRTGGLPMSENWNFAISKASGDWYLIIADKSPVKFGAFDYLDKVIQDHFDSDVFAFEYDEYFDQEGCFRARRFGGHGTQVTTELLEKYLLSSDFERFNHYSGRAYNSLVRGSIVRDILDEHGEICIPHNPDYTFCYHLMHKCKFFTYIEPAPIIARFRSIDGSNPYGNGANYATKGEIFQQWAQQEESKAGETFCSNVPIKGWLIYSILIDDFLKVAALYGRSNLRFKKVEYYVRNYKDTCYRRSLGADVVQELNAWSNALAKEGGRLNFGVSCRIMGQRLKNILYPLVRFLERKNISWRFLLLGKSSVASPLVFYKNIKECLISSCVSNPQVKNDSILSNR